MTHHKKLIEVALPLPEINDASAYDKMPGIGPHPKGIHHWWARLPMPTARAVLFASVVDDPSAHPEKWHTEEAQNAERERLFDIIRKMMGKKLHEHAEVYAEARAEMWKYCDGRLPPVYDPFAGGGSIPLEANRMGFEAHAGDLNPVAVLLNKCNLELAPRWAGQAPVNPEDRSRIGGTVAGRRCEGLAADVRYYGAVVHRRALARIGHLYPKVRLPKEYGGRESNVIAWIWARTVASPNPAAHGKHVPLVSTFILSSKAGRLAWVDPIVTKSTTDGWSLRVRVGEVPKENVQRAKFGTRAGKAQDFVCLLTGTPIPRSYVQEEGKAGRLGRRLMAIVAEGKKGKIYLSPVAEHESVASFSDARVEEARKTILAGSLPTRAEITGGVCTAYGLSTWGHLFETRQLVALLTLSDLVQEAAADAYRDGIDAGLPEAEAAAYCQAIVTFLGTAVDRCADFNNSLCRWKPSGEQSMHLFSLQALPMVWDFVEPNIMGEKAVCWHTAVHICADAIESLSPNPAVPAFARQADAATDRSGLRNLLVSTDPPYYDNISYGTLSDFFYVWLRRTLRLYHPELFDTVLTPKQAELIASPDRFNGSKGAAKEHFESGFRHAFAILGRKLDQRFPLTVYYAFKQDDEGLGDDQQEDEGPNARGSTGWETLLEALIGSGFQITATWPVRASQKWRLLAMGTNALASYIVLACRLRPADAPQTDRRTFVGELRRELLPALKHLQQGNISPVDFAQAAIGPGMAVYTRFAKVIDAEGTALSVREALALINQTLDEVLAEQEGDFDADSRWALAWFEESGFAEGDFGVADVLARAKNTSVAGMIEAGILVSKRSKARLLSPAELPKDWDPATDTRLTVWEMVHHLIRVLESGGEGAAAALAAKLGSKAETARELCYRLYTVCERKKRAAEALSYNGLVQSWPEITRLAREGGKPQAEQAQLFEQE